MSSDSRFRFSFEYVPIFSIIAYCITVKLIYPQWQGGDIARWITEIKDPEAASKGYFLGAELLNFLAPDSSQETLTVPISTEITERRKKDGVLDRDIIVKQTKAALDLLRISDPDKIVTLGGECFCQCRSVYLPCREI